MIITISCSMKRIADARALADKLQKQGHVVHTPTTEKLESKRAYIDRHLASLKESDALLLANFPENDNKYGRVGASGFFETGWAYALGKKVYYLNPLDPESPYTEDIVAVAEKFEQSKGENDE